MTNLKLMCYHVNKENEDETELIQMKLDPIPKGLPFTELVFVCPKCRKATVLQWDMQSSEKTEAEN